MICCVPTAFDSTKDYRWTMIPDAFSKFTSIKFCIVSVIERERDIYCDCISNSPNSKVRRRRRKKGYSPCSSWVVSNSFKHQGSRQYTVLYSSVLLLTSHERAKQTLAAAAKQKVSFYILWVMVIRLWDMRFPAETLHMTKQACDVSFLIGPVTRSFISFFLSLFAMAPFVVVATTTKVVRIRHLSTRNSPS